MYRDLSKEPFIQIPNKLIQGWDAEECAYIENYFMNLYSAKEFSCLINLLKLKIPLSNIFTNNKYIANIFGEYRTKNLRLGLEILKKFNNDGILIFPEEFNFINPDAKDLHEIIIGSNLYNCENDGSIFSWFKLYFYELDKIMNHKGKESKHKILSIFCNLKSRINANTYICYPSIKQICMDTKISKATTLNILNILENDLNLILRGNPGVILASNDKFKISNNYYIMNYEGHEEILQKHIEEEKNKLINKMYKDFNNEKRKEKISVAQKINSIENKYINGEIDTEEYTDTKEILEQKKEKLENKTMNYDDLPECVKDCINNLDKDDDII